MRRGRSNRLHDEANNTDYDSSTSDGRAWSSQSPAEPQMRHGHRPDSLPPGERTEDSRDHHNHGHMQSPLATSPGRYSGVTIQSGTRSPSASFGTETLLASTPRSLGLESGHLAGRPSELTLADSSADAPSSAATTSPISEKEEDKIVDRIHRRSKAQLNVPSSGPGNPSPRSDLASVGDIPGRTSRLAQRGSADSPVATGSVLLHSLTSGLKP